MPVKQNLKEHFEDGRLDLSMLGLTEVPVKDIAAIPKATSLDLSNNRLTTIGKNFPSSLTHLVHLDLARNQLVELPENFGLLVNLKHLDLYSNQLASLPLSFGNLKALRWLDLKQNPLMPKLAQIAGPCLDSSQCASAAKNVVELLAMMNKQVEVEKQRRQEQRQKQLEENERKAQELKKEQQQLKKRNRKAKRDEAENAKLSESMQNGNVKDSVHGSTRNETEQGGGGDLPGHLDNNDRFDESVSSCDKIRTKQIARPNKVFQFFGTVTKVIVISTLLIILGLFILNLLDESYYNAARKRLIYVRNQISAQLPKSFVTQINKAYVTSRKSFWKNANRLGKFSISMIQNIQDWYLWISTHEVVELYFEQIKSGWQVLWIRISEIYRTFLVDAQ